MAWFRVPVCFIVVLVLGTPILAAICPDRCVCVNTQDGLHKATCSSLPDLFKFTLRQKHHNINILDLSHNNITKLSHELDRLTEVVTLDLSTNGISDLNKFLNNAKKLVHLNLANNRLRTISLTHLPASVSSLDLTNNLLQDVPLDLGHLISLEHLELEGNPIECSCENIRARDRLLAANVFIDNVKCALPSKLRGKSWLELKTKDTCKIPKTEPNYLDMMMGDQPIDAIQVGEETKALKSMSLVSSSALEDGNVIHTEKQLPDDDSSQFLAVSRTVSPKPESDFDGSGDFESSTISELMDSRQSHKLHSNLLEADEILPADDVHPTDDPLEGSGEGSGFGGFFNVHHESTPETTTPYVEDLIPPTVHRLFEDEESNTTEFPPIEVPSVYQGGSNWLTHSEAPVQTGRAATPIITPDTTVSEKVTFKDPDSVKSAENDKETPHKTGTYVCIAIIVVLLVGLIGFAIIKGQMRKRRDRRLLGRQQKRDVEMASKEMVDMNKSLLGKPAVADNPIDKKVNGKYELVPTHEPNQKKGENGDIGNGIKHPDTNGVRTDSPRDKNQNKNSSKDHNLADETPTPLQDTSFESHPDSPDSRKDNNSLSSEDIFVPINDEDTPRINGNIDSDASHPLINGDPMTDSDMFLPSREYVPVYSPDMGRVRIKLTETPKPKTPVLVTRSRSNAGDIIITPSADTNMRKSTT